MINSVLYSLLVMLSGLHLSEMSMDCLPCTYQPDQHYGGILVNCSNRHCSLNSLPFPEPGNITTLLFDGNYLGSMMISDFEGMANLRHLSMRDCALTEIEEAPEVVFTNLEYLDLSDNRHLGFDEVVKVSPWLRRGTLKIVLLDHLSTIESVVPLDGVYCSFLQHTALKELHLDRNVFSYFGRDCFSLWPKTIEILSIRYSLIGGYTTPTNFLDLLEFHSVRSIDFTGSAKWNPGDGQKTGLWQKTGLPPILPIFRSLEILRVKKNFLNMDIEQFVLIPHKNNLTVIDLSENQIASVTGPLTGFANVEKFDVSHNKITFVGKTLFSGPNKVKVVNISNNYLGQCVAEDGDGDILQQFKHLEVLDVSQNELTFLPKPIFQRSVNLRYINISGNSLTHFDVDFIHMSNLKELNMRNNKLTTLPQRVIDQLNGLPKVIVIMDDNPLSCSCDTLDFLEWMRDSDHLQGRDNLTCTLTNGTNMKLQYLDHILSSLHESCKSDIVLIASSVSGAFALLVLVSGFMMYRHRWKLRYLYHAGRNRYLLKHIDGDEDLDRYQYDAFISYADTDRTFVIKRMLVELEDKSGLKVCIHNRDFLPGDIITENIINAIQNSRKTVILLSPEFLKSEWCIYEFHMARLDGITRKLNNLLVILLQEVAVDQLPKDLALMMTRNSYLEYSTDIYGEAVFWDTLTEGIMTLKRLE